MNFQTKAEAERYSSLLSRGFAYPKHTSDGQFEVPDIVKEMPDGTWRTASCKALVEANAALVERRLGPEDYAELLELQPYADDSRDAAHEYPRLQAERDKKAAKEAERARVTALTDEQFEAELDTPEPAPEPPPPEPPRMREIMKRFELSEDDARVRAEGIEGRRVARETKRQSDAEKAKKRVR